MTELTCVCSHPELFCGGGGAVEPDEPGYCEACDRLDKEAHCLRCPYECCDVPWWHAWGGSGPAGTVWEGTWITVTIGPSHVHPDDAAAKPPPDTAALLGLKYLYTWDHEPSDAEKDVFAPKGSSLGAFGPDLRCGFCGGVPEDHADSDSGPMSICPPGEVRV